jgi:hypothetical protein
MRWRIAIILAAALAMFGVSALGAFASTVPPGLTRVNCTALENFAYHVLANDNHTVGIDYQGTGNLIKVTATPGDSNFSCTGVSDYLDIHNNADNCMRMRDASNNYTMIEEVGCLPTNTNYEFQAWFDNATNRYEFQNVHFGKWLAVNCPPEPGGEVLGVDNVSGTCLKWQLQ